MTPSTDGLRFPIWEYEIEGNSVLSDAAVESAVAPFLGPDKALTDVEEARTALEKIYQGGGFLSVFVDIPEQNVDSGVVRLRVTEGRVERLAVTGARYYDQGFIRRGLPALQPGSVPNFNDLQQQLAAVSRDERQLQPVLKPGRTPGTVQAEVKVTDRLPLGASVELNNNHAVDTVPWRLQGTVRYDNLFQRDHALAVTVITAPEDTSQSEVLTGSYTAPLNADWTLLAYALWSDSVVEPLGTATVVGRGFTFGARAVRAFGGADGSHTIAFGADYKDLKEDLTAGDSTLSTPLRFMPFQLAYTGNWGGGRNATSVNAQLVFAQRNVLDRRIDCPGTVGAVDQFACKREGGDGSFTYLRSELRHTRPAPLLPGALALRFGVQLAMQPLVPSEQYAVGGADTVRGYREAEGSGDRGWLASAEWRSSNLLPRPSPVAGIAGTVGPTTGSAGGSTEPPAAAAGGSGGGAWWMPDDVAAVAFLDTAEVHSAQTSVGQPRRIALQGTGFGLRLRAARQFTADLDVAWPLRDTPNTREGEPRLHVKLRAQF